MSIKESAIAGTSTLALGGGVGYAVTSSNIKEPPESEIHIKAIPVVVSEIKVKGVTWKYLKRFFENNKNFKENWSAVLELTNQKCMDVGNDQDVYSNAFIGRVKGIIDTHDSGKYKAKHNEIDTLLNKLANSMNVSGVPIKHKDFCPEIKIANEKISEVLASFES